MAAGKLQLAPGGVARDSSNSQRSPAREPESPKEAISSSCLCLRTFEEHPLEDLRHTAARSSMLPKSSAMLLLPTRARQKLATQPYPASSKVQFGALRKRNNYLPRRAVVTIVSNATGWSRWFRWIAASQWLAGRCGQASCDPLGPRLFSADAPAIRAVWFSRLPMPAKLFCDSSLGGVCRPNRKNGPYSIER